MAVFPWLLSVILLPSIHATKYCVSVVPDSDHKFGYPVELGKEFTATCRFNDKDLNADNIIWSYTNGAHVVALPRENYREINESAVSVTFNVTEDMKGFLKCSVKDTFKDTFFHKDCGHYAYGILLDKGYPPEKPSGLNCQARQDGSRVSNNVTCHWNPGRNPIMHTTYTLFFETGGVTTEGKATSSSGMVSLSIFPHLMKVTVWVVAENRLGRVSSEILELEADNLIKTSPPHNVTITSEEAFPKSVLVEWTAPIDHSYAKLNYNIRFCEKGSATWSEVPLEDTKDYLDSFRLQSLKPYTEYVVQVRCKSNHLDKDQGYWSDWSRNATARTAEDRPSSKPDIWMQATDDGAALRIIRLFLKKPLLSNGKILEYEIKVFEDGKARQPIWVPFNNGNEKSFQVDVFCVKRQSVAYVEVTARNSVGNSPTADLAVPLPQELPSVDNVVVYAQDDKLWVEWRAPEVPGPPVEYVLQWVSLVDEDMDWQREPRNATKVVLKGNLRPYVPYNVTVVPIYHRGYREKSRLLHLTLPGKTSTVTTYLKEGVPAVVPAVTVARTWKNSAELTWNEIPLWKQRGFITNYTIVYKSDGSNERVETVSPNVFTYTLKNLTKDTNYKIYIKVSTVAGSKSSDAFYMNTQKFDPREIEMIGVSVCFGFLFLTILTIWLCFKNKQTLKKKFWPQVPDPYNSTVAKWSPDLSARAGTPKEAAIGDLSVVEVDVFDQKSLCDEDKTSLPALKKDKYMSEEHSSGIGGSSCMSSPRQSVSDSDEADSGQTTGSTVQYSSVVGYKGQTPAGAVSSATAASSSSSSSSSSPSPGAAAGGSSSGTAASAHTFARSESTQPLLECEEQQEGSGHHHHHHPGRGGVFRRHHGFGDADSSGSSGIGESPMHRLHPSEQDEQDSSSLEFCPAEDATLETVQPADVHFGRPPYMPQQSGYRPQ